MSLFFRNNSPLKYRHIAIAIVVGSMFATLANLTSINEKIEKDFGYSLFFKLREALGKSPKVNERLKIITIDDYSFAKMSDWVLNIEQWRELLSALAERNPKAIFIDAILSKPLNSAPGKMVTLDANVPDTKIISGLFITPKALVGRSPFKILGKKEYEPSHFALQGTRVGTLLKGLNTRFPGASIYGHHEDFSQLITHAGHILNPDGTYIAPVIEISPSIFIPHLFTFAADKVSITSDGLWLDDRWVPVNNKSLIIPNWPNPSEFNKVKFALASVFEQIMHRQQIAEVRKGDIVLIIPQYFTGNTDFKITPVGKLPGGLLNAALINDYLNNSFLNYQESNWIGSCILILLIILLASTLSGPLLWLGLLSFFTLTFAAVAGLFIWEGMVVSWFTPIVSASISAGILISIRYQINEKKITLMHQAFDGVVPHEVLQGILDNPNDFSLEAHEAVLTVVFIDIVNFSLISRKNEPKKVFDLMKAILKELTETIHKHHGIIDKTLGDGLLCYFSNKVYNHEVRLPHAQRAINCAIEIQKMHTEKVQEAVDVSKRTFSLRIGINTDICFMGDLGSGQRIDYTIMGDGVNIAKRLESACHPNHILISESSYQLLAAQQKEGNNWKKQTIKIKNYEREKICYDLNPDESLQIPNAFDQGIATNGSLILDGKNSGNVAGEGDNDQNNVSLWQVASEGDIKIFINGHEAFLVAFSAKELHIKAGAVLLTDDVVSVALEVKNPVVDNVLSQNNLKKINAQVDWGQEHIDGLYYYVLYWQGINEFERELLEKHLLLGTNARPLEVESVLSNAV